MIPVVPIIRRFRNQLQSFRAVVKDNWLYRRLVFLFEKWECLLACEGEPFTDTIEVTTERTLVRYPDLWAIQTEIHNIGTNHAIIYDNGVVVGIAPAGATKVLTLTNRYLLEADTIAGATTLVVTTHRRCACGEVDPQPYGIVIDPIGGNLI